MRGFVRLRDGRRPGDDHGRRRDRDDAGLGCARRRCRKLVCSSPSSADAGRRRGTCGWAGVGVSVQCGRWTLRSRPRRASMLAPIAAAMSARRARCSRRRSITRLAEPPTNLMHVVLNGPYWTGSTSPADYSGDGASVPAGSVCSAGTLQVDATEHSVAPLFGALSIDLHAKARVALQEMDGLSGLLPIAVRTPKPQTVAAAFYDVGAAGKTFLDAKAAARGTIPGLTAGLGGWTDSGATTQNMLTIPTSGQTGVVIATSFAPACNPSASAARDHELPHHDGIRGASMTSAVKVAERSSPATTPPDRVRRRRPRHRWRSSAATPTAARRTPSHLSSRASG